MMRKPDEAYDERQLSYRNADIVSRILDSFSTAHFSYHPVEMYDKLATRMEGDTSGTVMPPTPFIGNIVYYTQWVGDKLHVEYAIKDIDPWAWRELKSLPKDQFFHRSRVPVVSSRILQVAELHRRTSVVREGVAQLRPFEKYHDVAK